MRWPLSLIFLPLLAGCAQGSSGALGQTQASAQCSPTDLVCAVSGLDAPIATGASLPVDISVASQGSASPPLTFLSGDDGVFTVRGVRLDGIAPGVASLLVMTGGIVVDFFHVWVETPDALFLHRHDGGGLDPGDLPGRIQLLVGDELVVSAEPYRGPQRLLGEADATWTSDPEVVQILDEGALHRRRLVARAAGATTVEVRALDLTTTLELEVLP
ncbi:uncharacterized protein SOCE26_010500 [Sorangium cellulosum]|uniref:Secreted protein n=1 Tax=Sorangium cellulosum TaxID=56 RepID=A0A2L0EK24_SORCE|nr:hypothetical protein [Sorangium cellulosum]AUX39655.1 uncharacterized protein SOCE26_010500 [Sorangium cellulosum]